MTELGILGVLSLTLTILTMDLMVQLKTQKIKNKRIRNIMYVLRQKELEVHRTLKEMDKKSEENTKNKEYLKAENYGKGMTDNSGRKIVVDFKNGGYRYQ